MKVEAKVQMKVVTTIKLTAKEERFVAYGWPPTRPARVVKGEGSFGEVETVA